MQVLATLHKTLLFSIVINESIDMVPTKKKRSFYGCWTCRSRKVKCDNGRPSCQRCQKSNLNCLGYNIKLSWSTPYTVGKHGTLVPLSNYVLDKEDDSIQRRNISLVRFTSDSTYKNDKDLDLVLDELEQLPVYGNSPNKRGPFMVFQASTDHKVKTETNTSIPNDSSKDLFSIRSLSSTNLVPYMTMDVVDVINQNRDFVLEAFDSNFVHQDAFTHALNTTLEDELELHHSAPASTFPERDRIVIHEQLKPSALVTFKGIKGDINSNPRDEQEVLDCLFPNYYNSEANHSILEMSLSRNQELNNLDKTYKLFENLSHSHISSIREYSFPWLLSTQMFQKLITNFQSEKHFMMLLTFRGNVMDSVILPVLYRAIGQMSILTADIEHEFGRIISSEMFHKRMMRIMVLSALNISAFLLYRKSLFEQNFYGSDYLEIAIVLRRFIILELSNLIKCLLVPSGVPFKDAKRKLQIKNGKLVNYLITNDLIKELIVVLVFFIKIDELFGIIDNFTTLFDILDQLVDYLNNYKPSFYENADMLEKNINLKLIIMYYKFMQIFFFSTTNIDLFNYEVKDKNFEDMLDENYNKISAATLNDSFNPDAFFNIDFLQEEVSVSEKQNKSFLSKSFPARFNFAKGYSDSEEESNHNQTGSENRYYTKDNENSRVANSPTIKESLIHIPYPYNESVYKYRDESIVSTLELTYGMPETLFQLFKKTVTLTNHHSFFKRRNLKHPRNFSKVASDLETELKSWTLPWILYESSDTISISFLSTFHRILFHMSMSYYNSILIYFYIFVQDFKASDLSSLVQESLTHLEALVSLSVSSNVVKDFTVHVPFWPFFVCACGATLEADQARAVALMKNFKTNERWIGKQLIHAVWEKHRQKFTDTNWVTMTKSWDINVFLC
ncbi:GQ67_03563T0 [Komagataella phaffii]|nr:GQ67_03563T0 [Komagataella phaffii]AOA68345.1 GQ68_03533T0 [Komagataella phaffii GS115]